MSKAVGSKSRSTSVNFYAETGKKESSARASSAKAGSSSKAVNFYANDKPNTGNRPSGAVADQRKIPDVPLPCPDACPLESVRARNASLIANIKVALSSDPIKIKDFRTNASRFQQGEMTTREYHDHFFALMAGADKSEHLFMDLISLMPDESKRKALHSEYAQSKLWKKLGMKPAGAKVSFVQPAASAGGNGSSMIDFQSREVVELKKQDNDDAFPAMPSWSPNRKRHDKSFVATESSSARNMAPAEPTWRAESEPTRRPVATNGAESFGPTLSSQSSQKQSDMPDPADMDKYFRNIPSLDMPAPIIGHLEFLAMILLECTTEITVRFGDVLDSRGRIHQCSAQKRQQVLSTNTKNT